MKFEISQINLVELIFLIVQEMKISCYSLKWVRGIIGLNKENVCVYLIKNVFYTFFRIHFRFFFLNRWFYKVLKSRKNLEKYFKMKKPFDLLNFTYFLIFWATIFFFMNLHLKPKVNIIRLRRTFHWRMTKKNFSRYHLARSTVQHSARTCSVRIQKNVLYSFTRLQ